MAYGTDGFIAVSKQNSWGTATNSWHYVPIISEGLSHNIELITQESILSRYDEAAPREGMQSADGAINTELNPIDMGHFLRGACGSLATTDPLSGTVFLHTFDMTQSRWDPASPASAVEES